MQFVSRNPAERDWFDHSIHEIERWTSIQCAEPAAIMAAAMLYYRLADMELSVPYEGREAITSEEEGAHKLGKHTCGRCAISEISFAGVATNMDRKAVDMFSVTITRDELEKTLGAPDLLHNTSRLPNQGARPAYDPEARQAMEQAMTGFHQLGVAQSSKQSFWKGPKQDPAPISSGSTILQALIADLGLASDFL